MIGRQLWQPNGRFTASLAVQISETFDPKGQAATAPARRADLSGRRGSAHKG